MGVDVGQYSYIDQSRNITVAVKVNKTELMQMVRGGQVDPTTAAEVLQTAEDAEIRRIKVEYDPQAWKGRA